MGVQVSFGFGNLRLIIRSADGHMTSGGTDDTPVTEAVIKDAQGTVLGRRVFTNALALAEQICPGFVVRDRAPTAPSDDLENK